MVTLNRPLVRLNISSSYHGQTGQTRAPGPPQNEQSHSITSGGGGGGAGGGAGGAGGGGGGAGQPIATKLITNISTKDNSNILFFTLTSLIGESLSCSVYILTSSLVLKKIFW